MEFFSRAATGGMALGSGDPGAGIETGFFHALAVGGGISGRGAAFLHGAGGDLEDSPFHGNSILPDEDNGGFQDRDNSHTAVAAGHFAIGYRPIIGFHLSVVSRKNRSLANFLAVDPFFHGGNFAYFPLRFVNESPFTSSSSHYKLTN